MKYLSVVVILLWGIQVGAQTLKEKDTLKQDQIFHPIKLNEILPLGGDVLSMEISNKAYENSFKVTTRKVVIYYELDSVVYSQNEILQKLSIDPKKHSKEELNQLLAPYLKKKTVKRLLKIKNQN